MDAKEFFGHGLKQIGKRLGLTVVFFVITIFLTAYLSMADAYFTGLPIPFATSTFRTPSGASGSTFSYLALIFDVIFWYLASSFVFYKMEKRRK